MIPPTTERNTEDLSSAAEHFDLLVEQGFKAPVETFEELRAESGPFTLPVVMGGNAKTIEVRIFHADQFIGARRAQRELAVYELTKRVRRLEREMGKRSDEATE